MTDSAALIEGIFAHAPVALQVYCAQGRCLLANQAFRELFGTPDDVAARHGMQDLVRRAFAGEVVHAPAFWYDAPGAQPNRIAKGASRRVAVSASFFPLLASGGTVELVAGMFKDDTAEMLAREQVAGQVRLLRQLVEETADLVFVKDREGHYVLANPASARVAGHAVEEILGHTDDEVFPAPQARALRDADRRIMTTGANEIYDESFEVEGQIRHFSTAKMPFRAEDGRPIGVIGVSRDITDRKRAEEALVSLAAQNQALLARARAEEHWLGMILERTPTPLVFVEPGSARLFFANAAADRMAGGALPRPESADDYARLFDIRDLNDRPLEADEIPMVRAARGEELAGVQFRWHFPGDAKVVVAQSARLAGVYGHQETVLIAFEDVTPLKHVQSELEEAVRVRQDFLSIAGHELKTPLTSLLLNIQSIDKTLAQPRARAAASDAGGSASVLDQDVRLGERWRALQRQVGRLNGLIDQLLDVSRLAAGKLTLELEPLDLSEVVRGVVNRSGASSAESRVSLDLPDPTNPATSVYGNWDRLRVEQVVTNLVSNAAKYGGDHPVTVTVRRQDDDVTIAVHDDGIGIAPEALERIFDRFERAVSVRHYGGLGLGLWIVRQLVEAMGGTVNVESTLGQGSTFTVRLPRRG